MSTYTPDVWVVLEFDAPQLEKPLRKVFAGWYGGITEANTWKLNSGIVDVRLADGWWEFSGYSGSVYRCHPVDYHMSSLMQDVLSKWIKQAEQQGDTQIRILTFDEAVDS